MKEQTIKKLEDAVAELRQLYYSWVVAELKTTRRSYADVGRTYGLSEQTVYQIARLHGVQRKRNSPEEQQEGTAQDATGGANE